ncbi:hypothetical protein BO82DRAFT_132844 [Aspergillus uvarum CBS 121591]|uniref:Uncharacterized protein n=1 Tax=Aspergillus uvarum CBS 121591 TaxID=1448315 RepID=A0A319C651_9EURO|nr:hypothetical protein BO82DRAFT_132844 [Aspergillus uvarum CBS 121591]PYH79417.1 hypothetical protein BO82DRAFT_132844 [Aspergillus uvarum CBS 121591]
MIGFVPVRVVASYLSSIPSRRRERQTRVRLSLPRLTTPLRWINNCQNIPGYYLLKKARNFSRAWEEPWEEPWIEPLGLATNRKPQQPRQSFHPIIPRQNSGLPEESAGNAERDRKPKDRLLITQKIGARAVPQFASVIGALRDYWRSRGQNRWK